AFQEMTMNTFRHFVTVAFLGVFAWGLANASHASDSFDAPRVTVKFGDLNLSSPAGAATLYSRIRAAAKSVCDPQDIGSLYGRLRVSQCVHQAIADAVTKVNAPGLYAVYNSKNTPPLGSELVSRR